MPTSEEYEAAKSAFESLYAEMKLFNAKLQACEAAGLAVSVEQVSSEVRGGKTINTALELRWEFSDTIR